VGGTSTALNVKNTFHLPHLPEHLFTPNMKHFPSEVTPGHHDYAPSHAILIYSSQLSLFLSVICSSLARSSHFGRTCTVPSRHISVLATDTGSLLIIIIIIIIIMQSTTKDHLWYCRFQNKEEVETAVHEWLVLQKSYFYSEGLFKVYQCGQ